MLNQFPIWGLVCHQFMVNYLEDPQITIGEALRKSSELTKGYRTKLFLLGLIYTGLLILSVFTLFIGLIWLIPLFGITSANFYNDLKSSHRVKKIS